MVISFPLLLVAEIRKHSPEFVRRTSIDRIVGLPRHAVSPGVSADPETSVESAAGCGLPPEMGRCPLDRWRQDEVGRSANRIRIIVMIARLMIDVRTADD